jgi:hypothetical protein
MASADVAGMPAGSTERRVMLPLTQGVRVGQLFANPYIVETPAYQRAFAWKVNEAGRLLNDIVAAMEEEQDSGEEPDYFLSHLLFIDTDRGTARRSSWSLSRPALKTLHVVDGLQRLTTLTILFCALRDLYLAEGTTPPDRLLAAIASGSGASARPRVALRGADEAFLNAYVRARRGEDTEEPIPQSESARRIREVYDHFHGTLAEQDASDRRRLVDFLLDRCHVAMVTAHDVDRAHRMFMILNGTGKPLERHDIVKAQLFGSVPAEAVERLSKSWDAAQAMLGENFSELFSHLHATHQRPSAHIIATIEDLANRSGGPESFLTQVVEPAAQILERIRGARHAGSPQSPAIERTLAYLNRLPHSDWIPPALLWWLQHGDDAPGLDQFLVALDRLAHGLLMMGCAGGKRRSRFRALLSAIRRGDDLQAAGGPLQLSAEELGNIHFRLRDLHGRKGGPTAKLVLLRISDQLAGAPQSLALEKHEKDGLTIEHVLPRKPGAQWRALFPDPAERERCIASLGNCMVLTRTQIDRAANHDFAHKHAVYFETENAPVMALNEWLRDKTQWTSALIRQREAELLQHLDALWNLGAASSLAETGRARSPAGKRKRAPVAGAPVEA